MSVWDNLLFLFIPIQMTSSEIAWYWVTYASSVLLISIPTPLIKEFVSTFQFYSIFTFSHSDRHISDQLIFFIAYSSSMSFSSSPNVLLLNFIFFLVDHFFMSGKSGRICASSRIPRSDWYIGARLWFFSISLG